MKKKMILLLLAASMTVLAGCGSTTNKEADATNSETESESETVYFDDTELAMFTEPETEAPDGTEFGDEVYEYLVSGDDLTLAGRFQEADFNDQVAENAYESYAQGNGTMYKLSTTDGHILGIYVEGSGDSLIEEAFYCPHTGDTYHGNGFTDITYGDYMVSYNGADGSDVYFDGHNLFGSDGSADVVEEGQTYKTW